MYFIISIIDKICRICQRISEGKICYSNKFVKLMKKCAACTELFILILFLVYICLHVNLKKYIIIINENVCRLLNTINI